jgi:hypothetical protein
LFSGVSISKNAAFTGITGKESKSYVIEAARDNPDPPSGPWLDDLSDEDLNALLALVKKGEKKGS